MMLLGADVFLKKKKYGMIEQINVVCGGVLLFQIINHDIFFTSCF